MKRLTACSCAVVEVLLVVTLSGCANNQPDPTTGRDRANTDEIAVRRTLADTEQRIDQGDLGFVNVFAKDAVIIAPSTSDIVGFDAIRTAYAAAMKQASMEIHFSTQEIAVAGDLAYERGTYTLRMVDRKTGRVLQDVKNKHIHILKRQSAGAWKTWRMMINSTEPASTEK